MIITSLTIMTGIDLHPKNEKMKKTVTCQLCVLQDHTDNKDLDSAVHEGFTIGKGKKMYWHYTWSPRGAASCYSKGDMKKRWVLPDQQITIHWKDNPHHFSQ